MRRFGMSSRKDQRVARNSFLGVFGPRKPRTGGVAAAEWRPMEPLESRQMMAGNPLVISEINYNPFDPITGSTDNDQFEFIELRNVGATNLNLSGVNVRAAGTTSVIGTTPTLNFTFGARTLVAGGTVLIVKSVANFNTRYPAAQFPEVSGKVAGAWTSSSPSASGGDMANSGFAVRLTTPASINMNTTITFTVDDGGVFPGGPDGTGATLVLDIDPATEIANASFYGDGANWDSSPEFGGNPGTLVENNPDKRIAINEILANSDGTAMPPELDKIELVNISNTSINLQNWFLSDDPGNQSARYLLPNILLDPGEYLTLDESQFNPLVGNGFALSSAGETVHLVSLEPGSTSRRVFEESVTFDGTFQSTSLGRVPDQDGRFFPLENQTFGAPNANPYNSDVVISEMMYNHPLGDGFEFIELYNQSGSAIDLGANTGWEFDGVTFVFPAGSMIQPDSTLVVVNFDPTNASSALQLADFLDAYPTVEAEQLIGPYTGTLSNGGERLKLLAPDEPIPATVPQQFTKVLVDSVDYGDDAPWPDGPDGGIPAGLPGAVAYSLNRISAEKFGDDPFAWRGTLPNPGQITGAPASAHEGLIITELMYNPIPTAFVGNEPVINEHLEFIELLNNTGAQMDLSGVSLATGVDFIFPAGTLLDAGARLIVVPFSTTLPADAAKKADFLSIYHLTDGQIPIHGPYVGSLSDNGEDISLVDTLGNTIFHVLYNNGGSFPGRPDAHGSSLELDKPFSSIPTDLIARYEYLSDGGNWHGSHEYNGTPGFDSGGDVVDIVINEVLAHTDPPLFDTIELYNTTDSPINIGGWWLSDSDANYFKFQIPADTIIQPHSYVFYDQRHFNPNGPGVPGSNNNPGPNEFSLNAADGDDVWLVATSNGAPTRFADHVEFPATLNGETVGRYPNGTGDFTTLESRTLGAANSGPHFGPMIITEIGYNPGLNMDDLEFVELYNNSASPVNLNPTNNPRVGGGRVLDGVDFAFALNTIVPAFGFIVVVPFNPATETAKADAFRTEYGIDNSVTLLGPFVGRLSNGGERVMLQFEDDTPTDSATDFLPLTMEDEVRYDDEAPWPTNATGTVSLSRREPNLFSNDAASWVALASTPGRHPAGDGNQNFAFDTMDIDLLFANLGTPAADPRYDLTGDGNATKEDVDYLIEDVFGTFYGDANLDSAVTIGDLVILAEQFGLVGGATWGIGDFNGDQSISIGDLTLLAENFGKPLPPELTGDGDGDEPAAAGLQALGDGSSSGLVDALDWDHISDALDEEDDSSDLVDILA